MDNLDQVLYPFTSELIMCTIEAAIFASSVMFGQQRKASKQAERATEEARDSAEYRARAGMGANKGLSVGSPAQRPTGIKTVQTGGSGGSGGGTANLTTGGGTSGAQRKSMKVRPTGRYV